jgi:dienelactone hydrolase
MTLSSDSRLLAALGMTVFFSALLLRAQMPLDANKVFAYDVTKPLHLKVGNTELVGGVSVTEISYDSPKGGRVPGYMVVPPGKDRFAGIVYMHWGQGNKGEFLSEAIEITHHGAIGIMIDAPYWRPEVPLPQPKNKYEAEPDGYIQMVIDLRRAVDVLVARKDVDPNRIGYVGHSLGATWGVPLAAVEKRIQVFVLMDGLPPDWDDDQLLRPGAVPIHAARRIRPGSGGDKTV